MIGDSPGKRLASFRASLGVNQRAFASALGVSPGRIGALETDRAPLSRAFIEKIAMTYGVSADWLLQGRGEMLTGLDVGYARHVGGAKPVDRARPYQGDVSFEGVEYVFARRMMLSVSAGNGLEALDDGDAEGIAFPVAWMRRQQINADLAVLVSVRGDSMAPAIPDQALVLIHVAERSIAAPGIYAFNMDGESFVKRIIPQAAGPDGRPGAIAIISDNAAYAPQVLSGTEMNRIVIVGRVRAVVAQL